MICERTVRKEISTETPSVIMTFAESSVSQSVHIVAKGMLWKYLLYNTKQEQNELPLLNSNVQFSCSVSSDLHFFSCLYKTRHWKLLMVSSLERCKYNKHSQKMPDLFYRAALVTLHITLLYWCCEKTELKTQ